MISEKEAQEILAELETESVKLKKAIVAQSAKNTWKAKGKVIDAKNDLASVEFKIKAMKTIINLYSQLDDAEEYFERTQYNNF